MRAIHPRASNKWRSSLVILDFRAIVVRPALITARVQPIADNVPQDRGRHQALRLVVPCLHAAHLEFAQSVAHDIIGRTHTVAEPVDDKSVSIIFDPRAARACPRLHPGERKAEIIARCVRRLRCTAESAKELQGHAVGLLLGGTATLSRALPGRSMIRNRVSMKNPARPRSHPNSRALRAPATMAALKLGLRPGQR